MRQRVNLGVFRLVPVDLAQTRKGVLAIYVHGTRAADTLSARAPERQGGVNLVLDLDEGVQDHGPGLVEVNLVRLERRLLLGLVRVPSVDFELFEYHGLCGGNSLEACMSRRERAGSGVETRSCAAQRASGEGEHGGWNENRVSSGMSGTTLISQSHALLFRYSNGPTSPFLCVPAPCHSIAAKGKP